MERQHLHHGHSYGDGHTYIQAATDAYAENSSHTAAKTVV